MSLVASAAPPPLYRDVCMADTRAAEVLGVWFAHVTFCRRLGFELNMPATIVSNGLCLYNRGIVRHCAHSRLLCGAALFLAAKNHHGAISADVVVSRVNHLVSIEHMPTGLGVASPYTDSRIFDTKQMVRLERQLLCATNFELGETLERVYQNACDLACAALQIPGDAADAASVHQGAWSMINDLFLLPRMAEQTGEVVNILVSVFVLRTLAIILGRAADSSRIEKAESEFLRLTRAQFVESEMVRRGPSRAPRRIKRTGQVRVMTSADRTRVKYITRTAGAQFQENYSCAMATAPFIRDALSNVYTELERIRGDLRQEGTPSPTRSSQII